MIVKFFTHGTGSSKGVFDYLLKDKEQSDGKRLGAEVLRGDIDNQSLLIDSLSFKRKYTSGCLSFTESADQVTEEQKNELMDGFEQTIRAGLDIDRVAVSWVEHRDKGRLELNFVFANVDLEYGRAFQPYIHYQDKRRVNAWKDMQNIKHGFTDPNDPANKRLMAQRDKLPRDIKDSRKLITEGLEILVRQGVITSRDDVIQAITSNGFEIARETDKAISIKNPDPKAKRNIRLTGGLYERDFNFSREVQATVATASSDYRARDTERYDAAKQLYDSDIDRKRDYHKSRHREPGHKQLAVAADAREAPSRHRDSPNKLLGHSTSSVKQGSKRTSRKHDEDDREIYSDYRAKDTTARGQDSTAYQIRDENMGSDGWFDSFDSLDNRHRVRRDDNEGHDLEITASTETGILEDGQETVKPSRPSLTITAGHNTTSAADARHEGRGYSSINRLIKGIGRDASRGYRGFALSLSRLSKLNGSIDRQSQQIESDTHRRNASTSDISSAVDSTIRLTDESNTAYEQLSEYISTAQRNKEHDERIRHDIENVKDFTDYNNDCSKRNKEVTEYNERHTRSITEGVERVRQTKDEVIKANTPKATYTSPRPR